MLNQYNVSVPLQVWGVDSTYSGSNEDRTISATSLLKSVKQIILSRRVTDESGFDIIDNFDAAIGTAIHAGIERAWVERYKENLKKLGYSDKTIDRFKINPDKVEEGDIPVYLEKRVEKEILGWTVTGQFDMVFNGQLIDFKTTGTYTYETKCKDNDYILQGSIYRWLSPLITEDTIAINFIFKNWTESKVMDPKYPKAKVLEYSLPLKSQMEVTTFILDKLQRLNKYYDAEEKDLPNCTDEELALKPSVFAYYSNSTATGRATKLFDNSTAAYSYLREKGKGVVKERKGSPVTCKYCKGCQLCSQYRAFKEQGLL